MRHPDAKTIEDALAAEFLADEFPVHSLSGNRFIRIVHTTEQGEDIATEINLTRLAVAIERMLA